MTPTLPNFLIVGVQKSGTTFLAKHLAKHSDVFFSKPKELFFFNKRNICRDDLLVYACTNFKDAVGKRLVGEGSTNYFHHEFAMKNIEQNLGVQTKIIVCLRNPAERALSHYLHDYKRGRRSGQERFQDTSFSGYISRSFYADRIAAWQLFSSFKIMLFDDLIADGSKYYEDAASFLGLVPQSIEDGAVNQGLKLIWRYDRLTLAHAPDDGRAAPSFSRAEVEELVARYAADVCATSELIGRDLSAWLKMPHFE